LPLLPEETVSSTQGTDQPGIRSDSVRRLW
jgi:hypothetical protein